MPSDSLLGHRESLSVFQRSEGIRDQESKELFCQRFRRSLPCSGDSSYHPDLVPALDDIRVMLEPDEAILETELRNDSLFLLLITRDTFTVNRVSFSADRKQLLVELIRKLKSADHRKVQLLAPILSGILLGPVWETLRCYKRLIVIPSPDFTALPFEILPLPGEKTLLLERMEVLYQTSAWRWYATRQKPHRSFFPRPEETWWAFAGLAPSNRERCARVAIPATWAELEEVGDMLEAEGLPGQLMGSESASEEHFRMMLARSDIVHLATHVMQDHRKSGYPALMLQPTGMGYGDDGIHTMD